MKIINTNNAPQAIGPYSQAIQKDNLLFLSGQIPLNPANGQIIGDSVIAQTEQVLKNIAAVLAEANFKKEHVVKTTIFLADLNDFGAVNKVYEEFFTPHKPARSTVEVSRLPRDVQVEIELIAIK